MFDFSTAVNLFKSESGANINKGYNNYKIRTGKEEPLLPSFYPLIRY